MTDTMQMVQRTLRIGTVVHVGGVPMELIAETEVATTPENWTLAHTGREAFNGATGGDAGSPTNPVPETP